MCQGFENPLNVPTLEMLNLGIIGLICRLFCRLRLKQKLKVLIMVGNIDFWDNHSD